MHECFVVVANTGVNNLAGGLLNLWRPKLAKKIQAGFFVILGRPKLAQKIKMGFFVILWLTRLAQKI
jgi:hypothetical protein